jgi:hypothetical protein
LNDEQNLALIKLCVAHQGDYFHGQKGNLWKKISTLLEQDHGITLKEPRSSVVNLMEKRKLRIQQSNESGTVQPETDSTTKTASEAPRERSIRRSSTRS